ncbi:hypothetical protein ACU4GA_00360 [Methylobacterium oryzae CBMB20]
MGRGSISGGAVRLRIRRGVSGSRAGEAGRRLRRRRHHRFGRGRRRGRLCLRRRRRRGAQGRGDVLTGFVAAEQRGIEGQRHGRGGGRARHRRRHDHRHLEARVEQRLRAPPSGFREHAGRLGQAAALDEGVRERLVQRLGRQLRPDRRLRQRPLAALDVALDHDVVGAAHQQQVLDIVPAQQDQLPGPVELVDVDDPEPRLAPAAFRRGPAGPGSGQ